MALEQRLGEGLIFLSGYISGVSRMPFNGGNLLKRNALGASPTVQGRGMSGM